ncbi:NAD(P)-binding protein [Streptomyces sp. RKAG337]|uniref:NAD(P)-binding protein n=1 Tax=Streptomyces sp. RKAG337 TaxID=2893404 RepID=UPI003F8FF65B
MTPPTGDDAPAGHVDVLIVGAGLSGIGAACHLRRETPDRTFAILEARDAIGGTWDLFRYPGIRSDSDMQTLGYTFRPWTGAKAIADGDAIREYVRDTAREHGVDGDRALGAVPEIPARHPDAAARPTGGRRYPLQPPAGPEPRPPAQKLP